MTLRIAVNVPCLFRFPSPASSHTRAVSAALLLSVLPPGGACGTTWIVHPDGSGDVANLQEAVFQAASGDTILLGPGTFAGPGNRGVAISGKNLTVESMSGSSTTSIDCMNADRAFALSNTESTFRGITFLDGTSVAPGGAVEAIGSSATFRDCRFQHNSGAGEAGTGGGGAIHLKSGALDVSDCSFGRNRATSLNGVGGAICVEDASVVVTDSDFDNNSTGLGQFAGGGGLCAWLAHDIVIDGCTFSRNASDAAAALFLLSDTATVTSCEFSGNNASSVVASLAPLEISDCTFLSNAGTALIVEAGSTVSRCRFIDNSSSTSGGGMFIASEAVSIEDCTFAGNSADRGGAVYIQGVVTITRCTFASNAAPNGAHVYTRDGTTVTLLQSILASATGPSVTCESTDGIDATCCDVFGNSGGDYVSCLAGQESNHWNFSADPRFCDPDAGDFTLHADSPCLPNGGTPCGQIGAWSVGCGATPAAPGLEVRTWGMLKSLYRD